VPLTPVAFPGFAKGLDLRDQPDVVDPSAAIDLLNVTFTERGAVKTRDGYGLFTAAAGTNRYDSLMPFYKLDGTRQLVCGAGNRLEALSTAGAVVASSTAPTASPHYFCRFGGTAGEFVFCANGTDQVRQWNGTAFSAPSWVGTAPTGRFLAVTPWDNRLVNARRSSATAGSNPSSVRFSSPTDPLTFAANDYVDLLPGDGEQIQGVVAWRDYLFVFKESKLFVFYGTDTDSTGNPIFRFRTVDTGVGAVSPRAIAAGRDGVYFLHTGGVYRTDGGVPQLVSEWLDPFFLGGTSDFFRSRPINQGQLQQAAMCVHREQLWLAVPTGTSTVNDRVLVRDLQAGWWTMHDLPVAAVASVRLAAQPELVFALSTGGNHVGRSSAAYGTDNGAAIAARWLSGWFDYKDTTEKTIRELKVWGKGQLIVGLNRDYQVSGAGSAVDFTVGVDTWGTGTDGQTWGTGLDGQTWGSGRALTPLLVRGVATRGTVFSLTLRSVDGGSVWGVYRLAAHLRARRSPSVVKTEA